MVWLLCRSLNGLVAMLVSYWFGCYTGLLLVWLLCWSLIGLVAMCTHFLPFDILPFHFIFIIILPIFLIILPFHSISLISMMNCTPFHFICFLIFTFTFLIDKRKVFYLFLILPYRVQDNEVAKYREEYKNKDPAIPKFYTMVRNYHILCTLYHRVVHYSTECRK